MIGKKGDAIHQSQWGTVTNIGSKKGDTPTFLGRKMSLMPIGATVRLATAAYAIDHVKNASAAMDARDNAVPQFGAAAQLQGNESSIYSFNGITTQGNMSRSGGKASAERPMKRLKASQRAHGNSSRYYTYNRLMGDDWGNV